MNTSLNRTTTGLISVVVVILMTLGCATRQGNLPVDFAGKLFWDEDCPILIHDSVKSRQNNEPPSRMRHIVRHLERYDANMPLPEEFLLNWGTRTRMFQHLSQRYARSVEKGIRIEAIGWNGWANGYLWCLKTNKNQWHIALCYKGAQAGLGIKTKPVADFIEYEINNDRLDNLVNGVIASRGFKSDTTQAYSPEPALCITILDGSYISQVMIQADLEQDRNKSNLKRVCSFLQAVEQLVEEPFWEVLRGRDEAMTRSKLHSMWGPTSPLSP